MKKRTFPIWHRFLDGTPSYLARHYWWAYLWRPAIWFFDHQPVINAILFNQYNRLLKQTLSCLEQRPKGRVLQLTCVYGKLTPSLLSQLGSESLTLVDVATAQLEATRDKLSTEDKHRLKLLRMNAEQLMFADNSFATVLIFFLFHEMPHAARQRALSETLRIMQDGSRLVITEYGPLPKNHWLYRISLTRWITTYLEPFLDDFWHEDLLSNLKQKAQQLNKEIKLVETHDIFSGFYRVSVFELSTIKTKA